MATISSASSSTSTSSTSSAPVAFSGLVSGLDTTSIIQSIVSAAEASETQYQTQQQTIASQQSAISSISASLSSLGSFAQTLEDPTTSQLMTASSSDSTISVAVSGTAQPGTHSMRVEQLATAQTVSSNTFASDTAGVAGTGSLTIASGTGSSATSASISYGSTDTLDSIATKINNANAGVTASVLYDGTSYRLMVASTATGTANAATFTETGNALGLSNSANVTIPAANAEVNIDGIQVTRPTNVIDDALPGTTLTLNSVPPSTAANSTVTVSTDTTGLTNLLNTFVSNFNAVSSALSVQMTYNSSASTQEPLFGDPTMQQLQGSLGSIVSQDFGGLNLTDLGLSIDEDGNMSLDATTLDATLQANPNAITKLMTANGFGTALYNMTAMYTDPATGALTTETQSLTDQNNNLQSDINQIQSNATALQTRLQDEFNQLESTMSSLQAEGNQVSKILS
jgi:flagellar hook-associated protein 2